MRYSSLHGETWNGFNALLTELELAAVPSV